MTRLRVLLIPAAAAVFSAAALAAATPVSPPPGAVVKSSRPRFVWTLPANERSESIAIANKPDTTPEGRFFDKNVVVDDFFTNDRRQWSPLRPLYAGRYWWNVLSTDRQTEQGFYSTASAFRIPTAAKLLGVRTTRSYGRGYLYVTVRWRTNAATPVISVRVRRRGRLLWRKSRKELGAKPGTVGTSDFIWEAPLRISRGTRLKLSATIRADALKRTKTVVALAP